MGYICDVILGGLVAVATMFYAILKERDSLDAAVVICSIAGFLVGILVFIGLALSYPVNEDGESVISFSAMVGLSLVGGALAGGLSAGIWEQRYERFGITRIGQGFFAGGTGALIGLAILLFLGMLMMGG